MPPVPNTEAPTPKDWQEYRLVQVQTLQSVAPVFEKLGERIRRGLELSVQKLAPFTDPLLMELGRHDWLVRGGRELSYSGWLAWVIARIGRAGRVLDLLGQDPALATDQDEQVVVVREHPVPYGHESKGGSLDLLIRCGADVLIVLELKVVPAEHADTKKQVGYRRWVDEQPEPSKHCLLIAPRCRGVHDGDFKAWSWSKLAQGLRKEAGTLLAEGDAAGAGLVLTFCGIVEQCPAQVPLALRPTRTGGQSHRGRHLAAGTHRVWPRRGSNDGADGKPGVERFRVPRGGELHEAPAGDEGAHDGAG